MHCTNALTACTAARRSVALNARFHCTALTVRTHSLTACAHCTHCTDVCPHLHSFTTALTACVRTALLDTQQRERHSPLHALPFADVHSLWTVSLRHCVCTHCTSIHCTSIHCTSIHCAHAHSLLALTLSALHGTALRTRAGCLTAD